MPLVPEKYIQIEIKHIDTIMILIHQISSIILRLIKQIYFPYIIYKVFKLIA